MSHDARVAARTAVSAALARLDDRTVRELVDAATPIGSGIGGPTALLDVDGTPVFVKRLPLTALEVQPENARTTANLYGLPAFCHYGVGLIGGPGFGAWRELDVHTMTTKWVLEGDFDGFPLMYHWRVLPHPGLSLPEELADVERAVAYWHGEAAMRRRIEEVRDASSSIALFLEYIPQNLHDWLGVQVTGGDEAADRACAMVEQQLAAGTAFMNSRGLLHLDAHFQNILTDGEQLFFADYGLALSSRFDLDAAEADFFAGHQNYDACYSITHLVSWLITALYGYRGDERRAFLHACAQGERPAGIAPGAARIIARHAPIAAVMTEFYHRFQFESRLTPYPIDELRLRSR